MQQSKHGILEGAILTVLWKTEQEGKPLSSVKDVYEYICTNNPNEARAYTTIKTVMDRLASKKIITREKIQKKFCYKTVYSRFEMVRSALSEISQKYCCGDLEMLKNTLSVMQNEKK